MKRILYHGSPKEFNEFDPSKVGERITSLGLGHYLTPDIELAKTYGKYVMEFEVDITNIFDWDNLSEKQRKHIEEELIKIIPENRISHFGKPKIEILKNNKEGLNRYKELKEQTKDAYNDYAKARILDDYEIEKYDPSLFDKIDLDDIVVAWRENADLSLANSQQLMTLMNEYSPNLIKELDYPCAKFSNQIAIYDHRLATRVDNKLKEELKKLINKNTNPKIKPKF